MDLDQQIKARRNEVRTDNYPVSIGELITHVTQPGDQGELDPTDTKPRKPVAELRDTSES